MVSTVTYYTIVNLDTPHPRAKMGTIITLELPQYESKGEHSQCVSEEVDTCKSLMFHHSPSVVKMDICWRNLKRAVKK